MNVYQGRIEQPKMLREVFRQENAKYHQLLEIGDVVMGAVLRYERTDRYLG
jgi:exosome complex RNA-binding protein Rrp4